MIPFARVLQYGNTAPPPVGVKKVQTCGNTLLILKDDGTLYMKGINNQGQMGIGPASSNFVPWTLTLQDVDNVWLSEQTTIARKKDGTVWYTGSSRFINSNDIATSWTQIPSVWNSSASINYMNIKDIQFTFYAALVLTNDGKLYGSGFNPSGEITGSGGRAYLFLLSSSPSVSGYTKICAGRQFSVAVGSNGSWYRTGLNNSGQLGTGNTNGFTTMTGYSQLGTITDISSGYESSLIANPQNSSIFGCGSQVGNQINTGVSTGNQLALKNVISLGQYGAFKFFPEAISQTYNHRKFMVYENGIYSTSPSGLSQVSAMSIDDPNLISSGGASSIAFMYNGVLYGAGPNNVMGSGGSGEFYDARILEMPQ